MTETKLNFHSIFKMNTDGSIEPLRVVRIGGVQFAPGVRIGRGVAFGGVDLFQYVGRDFRVEDQNGILIITGIYANV